ncbi:hypothetical protein BS47DRAFT_1401106 [Hydnum rufescens UP504]|uniref:Uncharacterized protein n=1 Tax=Hydnum rufescens UP504 TaxID=1448309 RepID=A0A9P6DNJ7_9AGAM|nr:hypothetical protein BS47DRAFT_1401106 [Hydnum rufescens UP504]
MAKKPRRTKPMGHASDSTVRPTSDSTVRPALDSAATRRSNRSKLKEEALHVQPTKPQALGAKSRVKTYQKHSAQPHDVGKEPEKAADPPQAPQKSQTGRRGGSDPARFDGVVLESPTRPSSSNASMGHPLPDINPTPTPTPMPTPHSSPSPYRNPQVAEGLEGLGDEGDGFSEFPADQFEEPPGSEEEQRGLLGLPTVSETKAFGPNALHKAYSKGPGRP